MSERAFFVQRIVTERYVIRLDEEEARTLRHELESMPGIESVHTVHTLLASIFRELNQILT